MSSRFYAYLFAFILVITRICTYLFTPLLLDSIEPTSTVLTNISGPNDSHNVPFEPSRPAWQNIDPLVQITISMGIDSVLFGAMLLVVLVFFPGQITTRERGFPKRYLVLVGVSQSVSALLYQYSSPGERTAPYLQSFLGNFSIPMVFLLRFLLLKRRPTLRKGLCALAITTAGMAALIPTMFPQLEDSSSRHREGGASGAWAIIWPVIYIISSAPHGISNIALEKSMKYQSRTTVQNRDNTEEIDVDDDEEKVERLNIIYTLFFTFTSTFLGTAALFWVDFIPGFGMQKNLSNFLPQVAFNFRCIFGLSDVCGAVSISLAWCRMATKTTSFVMAALVVRYSEGANFYILISAVASPICFTFWTLFDEHPFRWKPEVHLSTWLSIVAISIMIPAIVAYERGPPEIISSREDESEEDLQPIIT
ncbi:hypothetical protein CAPTEDRAFT_223164 [Capitella teleta]|uniref:EamA domain-containing protein n=1 Tax=Capitella teleta TaxID=283909 RepID=R7TDF0_CAPTE|nr:hypothetical protein CAPTEDRAFT_223164 [Capitella teleta]|eukprot:ELT91749.1 hypothetical protein CAPTEDRAFT_223164 [Capitella teleta]